MNEGAQSIFIARRARPGFINRQRSRARQHRVYRPGRGSGSFLRLLAEDGAVAARGHRSRLYDTVRLRPSDTIPIRCRLEIVEPDSARHTGRDGCWPVRSAVLGRSVVGLAVEFVAAFPVNRYPSARSRYAVIRDCHHSGNERRGDHHEWHVVEV